MGIRFVIGRAGTGKSHRCFDAIVQAMRADPLGPAIFWILPKQATFTAQRQLACASGLRGFVRTHVLSFEELADRVLDDCGGAAVPQITELGRQMILGHLLREHEKDLRYFRSVARQSGLAAELDATFSEIERCGKTSIDLAELLVDLESQDSSDHQDQSLVPKLHDLRLLYEAYCSYLGQERLDPHRRLMQVLSCIESWRMMQGATVYIDGFLELSDYARRVIASMAKVCRSVEVMLLMDSSSPLLKKPDYNPDDLSLFHRTETAYRQLYITLRERGVDPERPVILRDDHRFQTRALAHVEKHLLRRDSPHACEPDAITLIEAANRRAEIDAAARQVRQWVREGLRYRDIAVLARDLSEYHELVDASFREHGIPCFVDRRRPAAHHPLLQFTRSILLIALHDWSHDAVMTALKSGLAGLDFDEADELENYVLLHRIRGRVWAQETPWEFRRTLTRAGEDELEPHERIELERIDRLRCEFVKPLAPFIARVESDSLTIRKFVLELFGLFERFAVRDRLAEWMELATSRNEIERHDEHVQVWANLIALFDQMVDLMGDEPVTAAEFLEILEFGLERFDLALTPPTVDQVLVGSVERTRNPQSAAVILLGMNEGQFPRVAREDSILSDGERRSLGRRLELDPDAKRRLFDENLLAYIGFTRASSRLTLTRAIADDENRPQSPSPYWNRLRELFPALAPQVIPRSHECGIECIGTPRQLVSRLMRWVREIPQLAKAGNEPWTSVYNWFATHACCDDGIDVMRYRAWRALTYANQASLSESVAQQLFRSPLKSSVSRIESFATCPFKHFVQYGLKLRQREDEDVTALDLGIVYHEVLEKIVREMIKSRRNWDDISAQQSDAAIKEYAREVGQTLRGELMLSSARNKYLLGRIERTLTQVIAAHEASARRSRFRPLAAELGFGLEGAPLRAFSISTPSGKEVHLYGKIDRVDVLEDQAAVAVIDYKLRGNRLELHRVYHGLSLQLLTYLLVLQGSGQQLTGRKLTPAAAFYVRLMRQLESCHHPDDVLPPDDPFFHLQETPRGIFDGKYMSSLDSETKDGFSRVVNAHIKKDGGFGNRGTTDVADGDEFTGLLRLVHRRLGELGDEILRGKIDIAPYRIGDETPCPHCEFRSVCRFDLMINRYHVLELMKREQVLERAREESHDGR